EADPALELAPTLLDPQQLLVAQGHVLGREGVVVAGDDELAIVAGRCPDGSPVQAEAPALQLAQVGPKAEARHQLTGALRVIDARALKGRQLRLEQVHNPRAM